MIRENVDCRSRKRLPPDVPLIISFPFNTDKPFSGSIGTLQNIRLNSDLWLDREVFREAQEKKVRLRNE